MWRLIVKTWNNFTRDECPHLAAALAYYALFSLPAILVLVVSITSLVADREESLERLVEFFRQYTGPRAAEQIAELVRPSMESEHTWWASLISFAVLLVGATGALTELQIALNRAWQVKPDPRQHWLHTMLSKRLLSVIVILGVAGLILISLVISWLLGALSAAAEARAPGWFSPAILRFVDHVVSLGILMVLFAALFRYLPDAKVWWSDVWAGAALTSLLFVAGKVGLGLYLAWSDPTTVFGAAGSLALVLMWIYYSGLIFLFGAEFTQVYARVRGHHPEPEPGAVKQPPHKP